jgi:hydrogenase maturation factor
MTPSVHTLNRHTVCLVQVPKDKSILAIDICDNKLFIETMGLECPMIKLPVGSWIIVGVGPASAITEEQAKELVDDPGMAVFDHDGHEAVGLIWLDYETNCYTLDTALASLQSWFKSIGLDPSENVLLIKEK